MLKLHPFVSHARSSSSWKNTGYDAQFEFMSGAVKSPLVIDASFSDFKWPLHAYMLSVHDTRTGVDDLLAADARFLAEEVQGAPKRSGLGRISAD